MKCYQSGPRFELVSPCPYPATITITPRPPPPVIFIPSVRFTSRKLLTQFILAGNPKVSVKFVAYFRLLHWYTKGGLQVNTQLQQYSGFIVSNIQLPLFTYQAFGDRFKDANYNWYHCHFHVISIYQSQSMFAELFQILSMPSHLCLLTVEEIYSCVFGISGLMINTDFSEFEHLSFSPFFYVDNSYARIRLPNFPKNVVISC